MGSRVSMQPSPSLTTTEIHEPLSPTHKDVVLILDESGSMNSIRKGTIDAVEAFLRDQRETVGVRVSLIKFNAAIEVLYDRQRASEVQRFTPQLFAPDGTTALLDAIGAG